ncbi:MAG TPA: hypothetical protein VGD95_08055 [Micavibrio sp.]
MNWNWKKALSGLFGNKAAESAPTPVVPDAVEVRSRTQLEAGTHRHYTGGELRELAEVMRDMKDINRHTLMALSSLSHAQPKPPFQDEPEVARMILALSRQLQRPYAESVHAMVTLNDAANKLDAISTRPSPAQEPAVARLPVCDADRALVISVASQLGDLFRLHHAVSLMVRETSSTLELPDAHGIQQALEKNNQMLLTLSPQLSRMTLDTLGKFDPVPPSPAP